MPAYEIFGKFYDVVMGDRAGPAEHLRQLIRATKPNATNVLEVGRGTATLVSKVFPVRYLKSKFWPNGFICLRRLRETPFEPLGLRADFCLSCWG